MDTAADNRLWFVARTRYFRREILVRDQLRRMGIENFVPTVLRRRTRGSGKTERAAAPNLVFVRTDKQSACALITEHHLPMEWIQDCATRKMMVVPDKQMSDFQRVFHDGPPHSADFSGDPVLASFIPPRYMAK